jgi:hypothetical protein
MMVIAWPAALPVDINGRVVLIRIIVTPQLGAAQPPLAISEQTLQNLELVRCTKEKQSVIAWPIPHHPNHVDPEFPRRHART